MTEAPATAEALTTARQALINWKLRQRQNRLAEQDRIEPVSRDGLLPVSDQQRYLWFLNQLTPDLPVYNMPAARRLQGELDEQALRDAVTELVARHESLRTRFVSEHGLPCQVIDPPAPAQLEVVDLTSLPAADRLAEAIELAQQEVRRPFDLSTGPLLRCWLARLDEQDHVLLLTCHHIISDGWSVGIITRELGALYAGRGDELPPVKLQPVDYAAWQQRQLSVEASNHHLAYWREQLADLPTLDLPTDRPRAKQASWRGSFCDRPLAPELIEAARQLAAAESVLSVLSVLTAAFYAVLFRYTGENDMVIGSVFSGRTRSELEGMVGFFANSLVLRTDLGGDPTGRELIKRCSSTVLSAMGHQDVPFGSVVQELKPERVSGRNPLFQICFTLLTEDFANEYSFGDVTVTRLPLQLGTSRFDMAFQVNTSSNGDASVRIEYSTELFDQDRIDRLVDHYETVLAAIVADPDRRLSQLQLLPEAESRLVAHEWNPEPLDLGTGELLLHDLVAAAAVRTPERTAVRFEGADVSYAELDAQANQLARLLQAEHRVGPEQLVAILLDRGPRIPLAQLAVLKAGGAWLPLDPMHPANRIAFQLSDAGAAVVITDSSLAAVLPPELPRVVLDDPDVARRLAGFAPVAPVCAARPDNAAYLIYTSGSTGAPKGVLVPHRAVVNFIGAAQQLFSIVPDDRVLQFANPAFDVSIFDIYPALAHGATVVGAPRSVLHDVDQLAVLLRQERITVCDLPPAVLGLLDPDSLPDLRALFVGLEAFPAELVNRWRTPRREFHNGYGPTEATVACADYLCPVEPLTTPPPIGRAMANYRCYVLDAAGNLAPIGVPGQLHVAGVGVARGYVGQPALTAERFLPCPYGEPGERMYATGDVVAWRSDGQLQFVGRADRQVKIRGLRIELGEIEHALASLDGIRQSAVVVSEAAPGGPRLDAYLVLDQAGGPAPELDTDALLGQLATQLPLHMVPATFTVLDTLPLNANGKLDRDRLPEPAAPGSAHVPPATETERMVAGIWRDLLNVDIERIGRRDSFFRLGGSSLQATQLLSRIRDVFYLTLDPRELFTHATLHQLATLIEETLRAGLDEAELSELEAEIAGMSEGEITRLLAESADE
ncbi:non-ribosomal peptide synthetase [Jatrophihabitans sp.]|uniref:non-ribosomal peptide synthetase n=1 Tax=Jatrophihabitans sp. TaxID=1932789 RepID=UPI002B70BFD0|nr:amino acid adenylation domain-containing protein [Jatrophihabitans sp.]